MVRSNRRGQASVLLAIVALLIASFCMMSAFAPPPVPGRPAPLPGGPAPFQPPLDPVHGPPLVPPLESSLEPSFDAMPAKTADDPVDGGIPPAKEGARWPCSGPSEPRASAGDSEESMPVAPTSSGAIGDEDLSYAPGTLQP